MSGLTSTGALMIVTIRGGRFSVLLVSPDGVACMVAAGEGFALTEARSRGWMVRAACGASASSRGCGVRR